MSMFTLANGERLYYEDNGGRGKTIVMLHGWTSSHEIYSGPAEMLKDKARVIIYDHRGHSGSKDASKENVTLDTLASDLDELIWGLGLSDVILIGWSMGAGVAMAYINNYGCDTLSKVIFCDMTPKQLNDKTWSLGLYKGKYTREDMERDADRDFLSLYFDFCIGALPKTARIPKFLLRQLLKRKLQSCDEKVLKSLSASMKHADYRKAIEKITVPVSYFYADPGSLFTPELSYWYALHVRSHYTAVRFGNATHMFIAEQPKEFAREVEKLLGD